MTNLTVFSTPLDPSVSSYIAINLSYILLLLSLYIWFSSRPRFWMSSMYVLHLTSGFCPQVSCSAQDICCSAGRFQHYNTLIENTSTSHPFSIYLDVCNFIPGIFLESPSFLQAVTTSLSQFHTIETLPEPFGSSQLLLCLYTCTTWFLTVPKRLSPNSYAELFAQLRHITVHGTSQQQWL